MPESSPKRRRRLLIAIVAFVALGGLELVGGGIILLGYALVKTFRPAAAQQDDIQTAQRRIHELVNALEAYRHETGRYPTTAEGFAPLGTPYGQTDPWGDHYRYEYSPDSQDTRPNVWSLGPDGKTGTPDDIYLSD